MTFLAGAAQANTIETSGSCSPILIQTTVNGDVHFSCGEDREEIRVAEREINRLIHLEKLDHLQIARLTDRIDKLFNDRADVSDGASTNEHVTVAVRSLSNQLSNPVVGQALVRQFATPQDASKGPGANDYELNQSGQNHGDSLPKLCEIKDGEVYIKCEVVIQEGRFSVSEKVLAYARLGQIAYLSRDYVGALALFRKGEQLVPQSPVLKNDVGMSYCFLKQYDICMTYLSDAIRLNPGYVLAIKNRARLYFTQKNWPEAVDAFSVVLKLTPYDVTAWLGRGKAYAAQYRFELSLADYNRAIELSPGNAAAFNQRCFLRTATGVDLDKAIADCNSAVALTPSNYHYQDSLGFALFKVGQDEAAMAAFNEALRLNPSFAPSLYLRGVLERRMGNATQSAHDIAAAIAQVPDVQDTYAKYGVSR